MLVIFRSFRQLPIVCTRIVVNVVYLPLLVLARNEAPESSLEFICRPACPLAVEVWIASWQAGGVIHGNPPLWGKFAGGCYEKVTWAKFKLLGRPSNGNYDLPLLISSAFSRSHLLFMSDGLLLISSVSFLNNELSISSVEFFKAKSFFVYIR